MNLADARQSQQTFLQHPRVVQTYRSLRVVWFFMIVSMATISIILSNIKNSALGRVDMPLLQLAAALFAAASFFVPGMVAGRLAPPPNERDPFVARLPALMLEYILRFSLSEASLILLLLAKASPTPAHAITYFLAALALMIFHFPK